MHRAIPYVATSEPPGKCTVLSNDLKFATHFRYTCTIVLAGDGSQYGQDFSELCDQICRLAAPQPLDDSQSTIDEVELLTRGDRQPTQTNFDRYR